MFYRHAGKPTKNLLINCVMNRKMGELGRAFTSFTRRLQLFALSGSKSKSFKVFNVYPMLFYICTEVRL
jgi:hypothetical protein